MLMILDREARIEEERKIEAYDRARSQVKQEGNTRAYYVLRAEAAEEEINKLKTVIYKATLEIPAGNLVAIANDLMHALEGWKPNV